MRAVEMWDHETRFTHNETGLCAAASSRVRDMTPGPQVSHPAHSKPRTRRVRLA